MADQKQERFVVEEPRRLALTRNTLLLVRTLLFLLFLVEGLCKLTPDLSEEIFEARTRLYKHIYARFYQQWIFPRVNHQIDPVVLKEAIGRIHMNVGWSPVSPIVVGAMALTVVLMGKGPKKKVWLSSEAVESKKND